MCAGADSDPDPRRTPGEQLSEAAQTVLYRNTVAKHRRNGNGWWLGWLVAQGGAEGSVPSLRTSEPWAQRECSHGDFFFMAELGLSSKVLFFFNVG